VSNEYSATGNKKKYSGYRGRFAPSPSGPLHFGSLVTAVASYLQSLAAGGEWLLRIEDIDPPRQAPGAAEQIIAAMVAHGFRWSGDILYQRHNLQRFEAAAGALLEQRLAFACTCSRKSIRENARHGPVGPIYPGTCRDRLNDGRDAYAIRMYTANQRISFDDQLQGRIDCALDEDIGDFVIRRKDSLIAYSLAVALDDHDQGITEIVRGVDLLHFTPAQIYLQRVLGLHTPAYMHLPIAVTASGEKLSKQTGAPPIDNQIPTENLFRCLEFLRQRPPPELRAGSIEAIWTWANRNWRPQNLANYQEICVNHIKLSS